MATEFRRTVIEPTRVIGPLRTARPLHDDELFRPAEAVTVTASASAGPVEEDDTQELDVRPGHTRPSGRRWRRVRLPAIVAASIGAGFLFALVLTARIVVPAAPGGAPQSGPSAAASAPAQAGVAQAGVVRRGDSGLAVSDLQSRLLRIPGVYPEGTVDGQYGAALAEAVARFQLWYGIRGDEDGEYGDATRRDLEARTGQLG